MSSMPAICENSLHYVYPPDRKKIAANIHLVRVSPPQALLHFQNTNAMFLPDAPERMSDCAFSILLPLDLADPHFQPNPPALSGNYWNFNSNPKHLTIRRNHRVGTVDNL